LAKTPNILKPLTGKLMWHVDVKDEKILFLTFDDGPTPQVTEKAMALLEKYNAIASFFCVGGQVEKYPDLYARIKCVHTVGNHSNNHNNGWKTSLYAYLKSYLTCHTLVSSQWYRPPYGKITSSQSKAIRKRSKIVMWDVLSGDFDSKTNPEACLQRVINNAVPGSIVVFHDSKKAQHNMLYALEGTLKHFTALGYKFMGLDDISKLTC